MTVTRGASSPAVKVIEIPQAAVALQADHIFPA